MLTYYGSLLRKLPGICFHAYRFATALAGVASAMLLLNQPILRLLTSSTAGFSRWWSVLPVGLLSLRGLMRANYAEIARLREQASDPKRIALKNVIGALMREGKRLPSANRQAIQSWEAQVYSLLERAFGTGEAELFMQAHPAANIIGGDKNYRDHMSRLHRLAELVARIDAISVAPEYIG